MKNEKKKLLTELAKVANPRHPEDGDAYETIGEYSNVLESSQLGGMFGMRWP